ncbi:MAG: DUF2339 domain-containing protein, partial [Gammaproteobacteria bacterium]|nr:DUF2339 domain-containing protein [Gammaproteobacteria bacterium]
MPAVIAIIALFIFAALFDIELALYIIPLGGLIFVYLQLRSRLESQQKQIDQLKSQLHQFEQRIHSPEIAETPAEATDAPLTDSAASSLQPQIVEEKATVEAVAEPVDRQPEQENPWGQGKQPPDAIEALFSRIRDFVWSYFTDGNVFVRVGLLILFCGVAFLLKYAAENSQIPVEFRFLGAAAGGLALLVVGWRLRLKKPVYGLLLQGGGVGIIYITIFAAYQLANLLPSLLTFSLLVLFSLFTITLAVLQNSRALAIFAVVGGFLAPILASSGSGNYIGLFSYYALLNSIIFAVAWFKSWRLLNLIGFTFTFLVYILWFIFDYRQSMLIPACAFLLLFFLMYSLIGIFYALRQPQRLKGLVDGTMVFGTPVIVSSLLMAMLRHYDYGIAAASACMGLYYVLLARFLWQRGGDTLRLIAEAMLAIGVVFATIAIPYSLDGHWSSATWALEAAGILWVSIRQHRIYAQWFAIVLQVAAGILFLMTNAVNLGHSAWINPAFLGGLFVALGAFISSRMLYQLPLDLKMRLLHIPFFVWAMGWWLFSALMQIDRYIDQSIAAGLILFTGTAAILVYFDRIRNWQWIPASISAALLLPILILMAMVSIIENEHVFVAGDVIFWIAALVVSYRIIFLLEGVDWPRTVNIVLHTTFTVFLACLLSFELTWLTEDWLSTAGNGYIAILTVFPLIFLFATRTKRLPAIRRFGEPLQFSIIASLSLILAMWSLGVNFTQSGDPSPLPYLPFINPVDIAHIAWFLSMIRCRQLFRHYDSEQGFLALTLLAGFAFVWLTAVLIRSLHFYLDIAFDLSV